MNKEIVMTKSGYAAVETELEELKTVKRKEVAEKIKVARGYGDLSANTTRPKTSRACWKAALPNWKKC